MIRQKQCVKAKYVKECEGGKEEREEGEEEEQTEEQPTVPGRQSVAVAFACLVTTSGTVGPFGCAVVGHLKENRLLQ